MQPATGGREQRNSRRLQPLPASITTRLATNADNNAMIQDRPPSVRPVRGRLFDPARSPPSTTGSQALPETMSSSSHLETLPRAGSSLTTSIPHSGLSQSSSFAPRGDSASRPSWHLTQSSNSASGGHSGSHAVALASTRQHSNPLQTHTYGQLHSPASYHEYQQQNLGGSVAYSSTRESVQPLPCSRECEQQRRDLQRQLEDARISYSRLLEDYEILQRDSQALSDEAERMRARTDDTGPIITREECHLTLERGREALEEQTGADRREELEEQFSRPASDPLHATVHSDNVTAGPSGIMTADEDDDSDPYGPSSLISGNFDSGRSIVGPEEPESIEAILFGPPTKRRRLGTASSHKPNPPRTGQITPTERPQLNDLETERHQPSSPVYAGQANPGQVMRPSNPSSQPGSAVSPIATTGERSRIEREPLIRPPKKNALSPLKFPTSVFAPRRIQESAVSTPQQTRTDNQGDTTDGKGHQINPSNPSSQPSSVVPPIATTGERSRFEREPLIRPPKKNALSPLKSTHPTSVFAPSRIQEGAVPTPQQRPTGNQGHTTDQSDSMSTRTEAPATDRKGHQMNPVNRRTPTAIKEATF
ncbi:hypothetical protein LTR99_008856 [Exophiala xenobiotica]|uniref:Uncharacterized protein n=1 Tax=Vermiconidia calcicola TaxID=1690605 RepID=A0AAV9Q428_9PEZI|nr:hypothetical protein LTR96_009125 [Exophiala xenobiotica]KAK5296489.1 hypothetical protein LTR99_008856 [Exophiala xenobiotica]KAK5334542.1 hypothetical protein LTR98_009496 [Exophiala xenobiotica]KAK5533500.1 hypothetical protein LTR25_007366 [Vermiconidia calcicola]